MKHHDDIRVQPERFGIAGFLIPAVPEVLLVKKHAQPQAARNFDSLVLAGVVYEQNRVDDVLWNFLNGFFESTSCIVGGQHNGDSLAVQHQVLSSSIWSGYP